MMDLRSRQKLVKGSSAEVWSCRQKHFQYDREGFMMCSKGGSGIPQLDRLEK